MAWAELPVTRRVVRGIAFGCALVLSVAATTSCGADVPSKADFANEIGKVTSGRVTPQLAGCVYDKLQKSDSALLRRAIATPDLAKADDDKMTKLLAQCIVDRDVATHPNTTTTTTTSDGSS
jgi:hypothetical protein